MMASSASGSLSDNSVQTHRLTLTGSSGHQQVGHLGQVEGHGLVRYRPSDHHRQVVLGRIELRVLHNRLHGHDTGLLVGHLYADCVGSCQGHHPHSAGRQRTGDIVLQPHDLGHAHSGSGDHLIQRNGRTDPRRNLRNTYLVVLESRDYTAVVLLQLLPRHLVHLVRVILEQGQVRHPVGRQTQTGVIAGAPLLVRKNSGIIRSIPVENLQRWNILSHCLRRIAGRRGSHRSYSSGSRRLTGRS